MVDVLADFPGWTVAFENMGRKELSRHTSGRTRFKDLGDGIWFGAWQSVELKPNALDEWRAVLEQLMTDGSEFDGYPTSRCRPIAHPASGPAVPGPITINAVGGDNHSFTLSGATGLTLRRGDLVQVGTNLHRVQSQSINGASFNVTPQVWPGTAPGDAVSVLKPHCAMTIQPGSISAQASTNGRGTVTFQGVEARG